MSSNEEIDKQGIILPQSSEISDISIDKNILNIDTNLSDLSYDDAKEYVINISAYRKELVKALEELEIKINYYYEKRPLAEKDPKFLSEVDAEIHKLEEKRKNLKEDELELGYKVKELSSHLQQKSKIDIKDLSPIIAELELDFDSTMHETEKLRMEDKLEQLKKKMNQDGSSKG